MRWTMLVTLLLVTSLAPATAQEAAGPTCFLGSPECAAQIAKLERENRHLRCSSQGLELRGRAWLQKRQRLMRQL